MTKGGPLETVGRFLGFLCFTGPAMGIFAAIILLPAYKHYVQTQHELTCLKTSIQEADQWINANKRLIKDLPEDEVLNTRLVMGQSTMAPLNEIIVKDPDNPPQPPLMINPQKLPRPDLPQDRLIKYATLLENQKIKNGLFILASGAILLALFIFSPGATVKKESR